ncbi:hypothetical protein AVEN_62427-1 [Araneus ventricosus]|uniref:Uncharacterized protein n=1 Tax=Araneus ventricosus TaxID=182803 RepID=A0A4Y2V3J8_ARAVE|nr:hypothetical protein AVEN_62427-1 [Araneus ventricosus]
MSTYERTVSVFSQDPDGQPPSSPGADRMIDKALDVQREWTNLITLWRLASRKEEEAANIVQKMMKLFFEQQVMMMHLMGRLAEREAGRDKYYSTAVKTAPDRAESRERHRQKPKRQFAVLVNPKKDQSSETTKKAIQAKVFPSKIEVKIKGVKKIKKGGIVIKTDLEEDIDKLIEEFKKVDEIVNNYEIIKPFCLENPESLFMVLTMI